jgi:phospholipase/lecithinase/hemolysin
VKIFQSVCNIWNTHTSNIHQQVDWFVAHLLLEGFNVICRSNVQLHGLASQLFDWAIGVDIGCNEVVSLCDCHWSEHCL